MDRESAPRRGVRWVVPICAGVLVVAGAFAAWFKLQPSTQSAPKTKASFELASVARKDLVKGQRFPGTLGFGATAPIPFHVSGTVTWLPRSGSVVRSGEQLLRVDDSAVFFFQGHMPAYRELHAAIAPTVVQPPAGSTAQPGSTPSPTSPDDPGTPNQAGGADGSKEPEAIEGTVGDDVRQLEEGLRQLGYGGFTVDRTFTPGTAAAVKLWQVASGIEPTGVVSLGDVVFLPQDKIRIRVTGNGIGFPLAEDTVLQQGLSKVVTVPVTSGSADWASSGTRVKVRLPNGKTVTGQVSGGSKAHGGAAEEGASDSVLVTLPPSAQASPLGDVQVVYVTERRNKVLVVPVTALISLAEGGFAVQQESGALITVVPGLYSGSEVEVEGDVQQGMQVRVPK